MPGNIFSSHLASILLMILRSEFGKLILERGNSYFQNPSKNLSMGSLIFMSLHMNPYLCFVITHLFS